MKGVQIMWLEQPYTVNINKKRHQIGYEMRPKSHIEENKRFNHDFNLLMEWLCNPDSSMETFEMLAFYNKPKG